MSERELYQTDLSYASMITGRPLPPDAVVQPIANTLADLEAETKAAYEHWQQLAERHATLRIREARRAAAMTARECERCLLDDTATSEDIRSTFRQLHRMVQTAYEAETGGQL
jgi:hypothetical protein